jgi:hypothetical protein
MAERISEIMNSAGQEAEEWTPAERTLDDICAATLKRRGRRGRPKGTGRKHPEKCSPKPSGTSRRSRTAFWLDFGSRGRT